MRNSTRLSTHAMSALFVLLILAFPSLAIAQAPTGAPVLLFPDDGAEIVVTDDPAQNVVLQWELLAGATTHEMQLFYTSDTSAEPVPLKTKVLTADADTLLISELLALDMLDVADGDSTFFWRVRGRNADGESEWSAAWMFKLVTLPPPNTPPTWIRLPADGTEIDELVMFADSVKAEDAEDDPITYDIDDAAKAFGFTINPDTGDFSWTPIESQAGPASYDITFSASDPDSTVSATVTIIVNEVNQPPVLAEIVVVDTIIVNQLHDFPVMATDADTIGLGVGMPFEFNPLTFSLDATSAGLGMAITSGAVNGEATFAWTPDTVGVFDITMTVNDGIADDSQLFQLVVVPATCPRLEDIADQTVVELNTLNLTFRASNECPAGTFTLDIDDDSKMAGMSIVQIDDSTGAFSWTPLESQAPDTLSVIASISDGDSTNTQTFRIIAQEFNLAPVLSLRDATDTTIVVDTVAVARTQSADPFPEVTFRAFATDPDTLAITPAFKGNDLFFALASPLDPAMSIDENTGVFSWQPQAVDTVGGTVVVTDNGDPVKADSQLVTLIVGDVSGPEIVVIDPQPFCSAAADFDIDWNPVQADGYLVQIAADPDFNDLVEEISVSTSSAKTPLANLDFGVTYYWRVITELNGQKSGGSLATPFSRWQPEISVAHTLAYPKATESGDFRMISIPGQSAGIPVATTFSGNQAPAGPLRANGDWDWSIWQDNSNNTDYPIYLLDQSISDTPFAPGVGYWAISTSAWEVPAQTIANAPLTNDRFFGIPLNQGNNENDLRWTMIGNPFDFPILWQDLIDENVLVESFDLWDWTGQRYENVTVMEPYKGYYYFNSKNDPTLNMPCILTPVEGAGKQQVVAKTETAGKTLVVSQHEDSNAMSPALSRVTVKSVEGATAGFDRFDRVVPRAYFEKHRVTLVNEEMEMTYPYFIEEARDASVDEQVFNIELKSVPGEPTYLNIAGLDAFMDQEVYLFDDELGRAYNLHEDAQVMIEPAQETSKLRLLMGSKDFIASEVDALTPKGFKLQQSYPNPFVDQTTIEYALPDPDFVSLEIYNVIGQRVRTLVHTDQDAGYHQVAWDGTSDTGEPVASGLYLYVFRSSTHQATERLVRVR